MFNFGLFAEAFFKHQFFLPQLPSTSAHSHHKSETQKIGGQAELTRPLHQMTKQLEDYVCWLFFYIVVVYSI